jgi:cyclic pyranopterin phosphate synthase
MPPEGLPWLPREELLTFEEILRITGVLIECGIRSIKLTGGEPLVRRNLEKLVADLRGLDADLDISLTTNGFLLADRAATLAAAGLDRATVSCDSLVRHRFAKMTLRDALDEVLRGLSVAAEVGLNPIKVNSVVIRGENEEEAVDFARLARETGYEIRFIEYMPLDAQDQWDSRAVVPAAETLARIAEVFPLEAIVEPDGSPSATFRFADGAPGAIGVIPSVTEPFCDSCNRLRLTSDGQLRACLFSLEETDLRSAVRSGCSDDDIEALARSCVAAKWSGHRIGQADFVKPGRSMSQIGG